MPLVKLWGFWCGQWEQHFEAFIDWLWLIEYHWMIRIEGSYDGKEFWNNWLGPFIPQIPHYDPLCIYKYMIISSHCHISRLHSPTGQMPVCRFLELHTLLPIVSLRRPHFKHWSALPSSFAIWKFGILQKISIRTSRWFSHVSTSPCSQINNFGETVHVKSMVKQLKWGWVHRFGYPKFLADGHP